MFIALTINHLREELCRTLHYLGLSIENVVPLHCQMTMRDSAALAESQRWTKRKSLDKKNGFHIFYA